MKLNSIRFKISVLYTTILGVFFIAFSIFLHITLGNTLYRDFDAKLKLKAQTIINTVSFYLDILGYDEETMIFALHRIAGQPASHPYQRMTESMETAWLDNLNDLGIHKDFLVLLDSQGVLRFEYPQFSPQQVRYFTFVRRKPPQDRSMFGTVKIGKETRRIITLPFMYRGNDVYILQVWTSLEPINALIGARTQYRFLFIPVIMLVGFFVGGVLAGRILHPVDEITDTAKKIASGDLSARVKTIHADAEIQNLVYAFNNMIARLEKSFKYIAEFSSHVAHELKTPLAIIRGEAEIALKKKRACEEYERVITVTVEESQRMLKIIEGLLLLTRLDYIPEAFKFERVDLGSFIKEIHEESSILAAQHDIVLSTQVPKEQIFISADKLHLRRVFFNLIDNALKYTSPKGSIGVSLSSEHGKARISFADTGIGIAEKDLPLIFNKFSRLTKSTGSNVPPGVGLGLSIVQSIVRMHQGTMEVRSTLGKGTTFTIILPVV